MKNTFVLFIVVVTMCVLFPGQGWTGGMHFGGGQSHGHLRGGPFSSGSQHFAGGMYRNFGSPGPSTNYGSPAFRSPGFGRSSHCPYPPRSFRQGIPFFSPGFSSHRFVYRQRSVPAGPPPVGAPGLTPYASATPPKAPTFFYCVSHAFHYTNQEAFFGHLNFAHHVPLSRAADYCQQVEDRLIFSGD